ncbi:MAG: hypothetical protein ACKOXB_12600 [Flavobacteriales bacterium]
MKILSTALLVMAMATSLFAQPDKKREEIKAMKIGFITKELSLTPEEAQKFWPVYNEFQEKMEKIHNERREMRKAAKDKGGIDSLPNVEVEKMVDKEMQLQERELQIKKEFHTKVKTVLPIKKVAKLYRAEHEFRKQILKKMKEHHGPAGKGGPGHHPGGKPDGEPDDE